MSELDELTDAIRRGDRVTARAATDAAMREGRDPDAILAAMIRAMGEIGQLFADHEVFVPEMLISARAMKESMGLLEPMLVDAGVLPIAKAVVGTVKGDLHDIGKDLVAVMWKGAHIDIVDLGVDVPTETFVEAVREHRPDVLGVSALLTTTMPLMAEIVRAVRAAGFADVAILVGGAPVTQAFADSIGASGYAPDAPTSVDTIRRLLGR